MRTVIPLHQERWRDASAIVVTVIATLLALRWAVGPQTFDLAVPFSYSGDGLSHGVLIKSLLEEGWFPAFNAHLGAPFVAAQFDYPGTDALHYLILRAIGALTSDWARVENIYVLVGFALTAAAAYLVLRALGVYRALAIVGGMLYALLPYHMLRVEHPFLAACFSAPLAICLAIQVFASPLERTHHSRVATRTPAWHATVAAVIVGASGVYYATFALLLIIATALLSLIAAERTGRLARALVLASIIAATVATTMIPTVWYRAKEGPNPQAVQRDPAESERYALTLAELVFPRPAHRNAVAREFIGRYHVENNSNLERETAALGAVPAIGFVLLLGVLLWRLVRAAPFPPFDTLAIVLVICFIVGTIGGLGSVIAWTVSPLIRAYSRISVFIAFCSLAAVLLGLQRLLSAVVVEQGARDAAIAAAALVLLVIGVADQTSPSDFRREAAAREFASDREFVRKAESLLPRGAAIYQLPYHPYPEAGPLHSMADYDLFRGYLHAIDLRWSHGNIRGRSTDAWQRELARYPVGAQIAIARESGFDAVYVDRRGFADHGSSLEMDVRRWAGAPAVVSSDGNLALFDLAHAAGSTEQLPKFGDLIDLGSPEVSGVALNSFGAGEGWGRWTIGRYAHIVFLRPLPSRFAIELEVVATLSRSAATRFDVRVGKTAKAVELTKLPTVVRLEFDSRGDGHTLTFDVPRPITSAAAGVDAKDKRALGVGIKHIRVIPLPNETVRISQKETPLARGF